MISFPLLLRSTGCVVLEMVQGKRPWAELESDYQIMFKVEWLWMMMVLMAIIRYNLMNLIEVELGKIGDADGAN